MTINTGIPSDFDIVICGGGLVGCSLAIALAQLPLRIALVEARSPQLLMQADQHSRPLAISYSNSLLLTKLGIWPFLQDKVHPIATIHVSEQGHYGSTRLTAQSQHVPALGYIVLAPDLNTSLYQGLKPYPNIHLISPASLHGFHIVENQLILNLQQPQGIQTLSCQLAIAADGAHSTLRQLLQIPTKQKNYNQTAITSNISLVRPHQQVAYERFTRQGAIALLPLSEQRCGLVWSLPTAQAESLMHLSEEAFLAELQLEFGYRLGRFNHLTKRFSHPLQLVSAQELIGPRTVLVGNAAHTLHPIAGQGFNLGLKDVASLTQIIEQALTAKEDIGSAKVLARYAQQQLSEQQRYIQFTDTLVKLFSHHNWPLTTARTLGLNVFELLSPLKKAFIHTAMGFK